MNTESVARSWHELATTWALLLERQWSKEAIERYEELAKSLQQQYGDETQIRHAGLIVYTGFKADVVRKHGLGSGLATDSGMVDALISSRYIELPVSTQLQLSFLREISEDGDIPDIRLRLETLFLSIPALWDVLRALQPLDKNHPEYDSWMECYGNYVWKKEKYESFKQRLSNRERLLRLLYGDDKIDRLVMTMRERELWDEASKHQNGCN